MTPTERNVAVNALRAAGYFAAADKLELEGTNQRKQQFHDRAVAYYDALDNGYVDDADSDLEDAIAYADDELDRLNLED